MPSQIIHHRLFEFSRFHWLYHYCENLIAQDYGETNCSLKTQGARSHFYPIVIVKRTDNTSVILISVWAFWAFTFNHAYFFINQPFCKKFLIFKQFISRIFQKKSINHQLKLPVSFSNWSSFVHSNCSTLVFKRANSGLWARLSLRKQPWIPSRRIRPLHLPLQTMGALTVS
jgi:hypothetical protein